MILVLLVMLFPFYWIVNMSLQDSNQLYAIPPNFFPPAPTLENFRSVLLEETGLMRFYEAVFNTLVVAVVTMGVCVALGSITGYALARLKFRWGLWFLFALIGTQMVPPMVDLIPLYIIFSRILKLMDTKAALIIGYTGWLLPISVWILYGYFQTIPARPGERGPHRRLHPPAGAVPGGDAPLRARHRGHGHLRLHLLDQRVPLRHDLRLDAPLHHHPGGPDRT